MTTLVEPPRPYELSQLDVLEAEAMFVMRGGGRRAGAPRPALQRRKRLRYRLDVNTLHRDEAAGELALNEIGWVVLRTTTPLMFDDYRRNRTTGTFILVDEASNATVGAGMILGPG